MGRIPLVGGVSSPGDSEGKQVPFQFANWHIYEDAVVGAFFESGVPSATSVANGFKPTNRFLQVDEITDKGRRITAFSENHQKLQNRPAVILKLIGKPVLLGQVNVQNRHTPIVPTGQQDGSIILHREVPLQTTFVVMEPDKKEMAKMLQVAITQSRQRASIVNPVATFMICCMGLYRHRSNIGFDLGETLHLATDLLNGTSCIGGLFDGEIGLDNFGQTIFTNWSTVPIVFGDEVRERALIINGFEALGKYGPQLLSAESLEKVCSLSVGLVYETGYPGAMLSLVFADEPHSQIVAVHFIGEKFEKIKNITRRPEGCGDLLWKVIDEGNSRYISDLRVDSSADQKAVAVSQLISHYLIPLKKDGKIFGVLHVDMGDIS